MSLMRRCAQGHDAQVTCCSFSPDGSNVATAAADGVVRVWAPASLPMPDSNRAAMLQCGAAVSCLAWDLRAGASNRWCRCLCLALQLPGALFMGSKAHLPSLRRVSAGKLLLVGLRGGKGIKCWCVLLS